MTWFWGVWWAWTPTGWQICFGLGQVTLALLAQLPNPEPVSELSDERLAQLIADTRKNPELWP